MRGACLCGAVAFEVDPPLRDVVACHCRQCRKTSGHYWAASAVPLARFRLIRAQGLRWFRSSDSASRGFCVGCGASLFWQPHGRDQMSFAAGALEGPTGLKTLAHILTEFAGDYYRAEGPPPDPSGRAAQLQGGCLCGANRFTLPGPMGEVGACHCTQCRKLSGHYSASFDAAESDLAWSARHLAEYVTPGGGRRGFCPDCGSSLFFRAADGGFSVEAGCIDSPTGGQLRSHIFVADKGDYYDIDDGLPQFPAWDRAEGWRGD
ncbi:GFA family protein [Xinfangfangia pollutisoli]|uniref:GFA family protein n=1 Tax=Xinfangfangia pollutisoli TaxID=2865960 RepID=UPI00296E51F5|nr:GFA family protein [Xinfangfangia pollutisoli]